VQEVIRNRNLLASLGGNLQAFADDPMRTRFPFLRCRNSASGDYLSSPFPVPGPPIDAVDQYFEAIRILNDLADSMDNPVVGGSYRKERANAFEQSVPQANDLGMRIEAAVTGLLIQLTPTLSW
jgi:hypothetical protein